MSFIKEYAQKLVTAEEAVKVVKSHDWVDYGWTTGTPVALQHQQPEQMNQKMLRFVVVSY